MGHQERLEPLKHVFVLYNISVSPCVFVVTPCDINYFFSQIRHRSIGWWMDVRHIRQV